MTAPVGSGYPPQHDPSNETVGNLFGDVTKDISTLIRQEFALAKAETQESAKKAGIGAGMLGGAAWAASYAVLFLSLALWWALGAWIGEGDARPALGWSALIVMILWATVAAVLALRGKKELKETKGLPQTAQTVKKIPDALKGQEPS